MPTPERRVQRVRHELRRREVHVVNVEQLGESFVSVTFAGDELATFVSASFDDHIKFMFTDADGEVVKRDYTPRRFDCTKREVTVEFAMHGDGKAASWAHSVTPGQQATIGGPKGSMIVAPEFDWHLLVGDITALPAIHRRLEELPDTSRAIVLVQLESEGDRRAMGGPTRTDVQWLRSPDELIDALRALSLPDGEGFAWGGGEASMMKRVRAVLVDEKGHPTEAMRVSAYWRKGASDFHEDLTG